MKKPPHILFISAFHTPFIQDDLDLLSRFFRVQSLIGHGFTQVLRILWSTPRHDIVFCWFASVYAAIGVMAARFFGKKSIIVVGGVDVAREPGLNYGMFLNPWKSVLVKYALRNASRVLVVDETLRSEINERIAGEGKNIRYVPTGYDTGFWTPKGDKRSEVLTVAVVLNEKRVRLKGIDTLIEAARNLPRVQFKVVGVRKQAVQQLNPPSNMHFYEPIPRSDLLAHYRRAQVYCQPSRREGLPNTLCEAMLCECIPVATTVGGIPSAVGKTGFLVPPDDPIALTIAITMALKAPQRNGKEARKRIVKDFPVERREKALEELISDLTL